MGFCICYKLNITLNYIKGMKSMIRLENVTWEMFSAFKELAVNENQNKYVSSSLVSLSEAYVLNLNQICKAEVKAIFNEDCLIGHAFIHYYLKGENSFYNLQRFMLDKKYQGKGYGKNAFDVVLDYIKTLPMGKASKVVLEYMPDNAVASHIYHSYGFVDTDEINQQGEVKAELMLGK